MDTIKGSTLSTCPYFQVDRYEVESGERMTQKDRTHFAIVAIIEGSLSTSEGTRFEKGDFFLLPVNASELVSDVKTVYLETVIPV